MTADPIRLAGGLNQYQYVDNNPIGSIDPLGLLKGLANGSRPDLTKVPSVKDGEFSRWFNQLTPDEFDQVWADPNMRKTIQARLRQPGGLHEWHMVARADVFKRWGVSAEDIANMRTSIPEVKFDNPIGKHGGSGSTAAHNEILKIIDSSLSYDDFKRRLGMWSDYRLQGGRSALPSGLNSHSVPNK